MRSKSEIFGLKKTRVTPLRDGSCNFGYVTIRIDTKKMQEIKFGIFGYFWKNSQK